MRDRGLRVAWRARFTCSRMRRCAGLSPEGWASRVAAAAARWDAGLVVAEANNGGAMVESVLKAADCGLKVRLVHASRGKCARAEPIALKFETGKAFFAGEFRGARGRAWRDDRGRRLRRAGALARPRGRDGMGDDGAGRDAERGAAGAAALIFRGRGRHGSKSRDVGPVALMRPAGRRFRALFDIRPAALCSGTQDLGASDGVVVRAHSQFRNRRR